MITIGTVHTCDVWLLHNGTVKRLNYGLAYVWLCLYVNNVPCIFRRMIIQCEYSVRIKGCLYQRKSFDLRVRWPWTRCLWYFYGPKHMQRIYIAWSELSTHVVQFSSSDPFRNARFPTRPYHINAWWRDKLNFQNTVFMSSVLRYRWETRMRVIDKGWQSLDIGGVVS